MTLIEAKTGPRHVLLGDAARELLGSLAESASGAWAFPGRSGDGRLIGNELHWFWTRVGDAAAGTAADARRHDLCHAHAPHAMMNGESLHMAGRLLGHRRASTTNRYLHLDDVTLGQAAERVAAVVKRKLSRDAAGRPETRP